MNDDLFQLLALLKRELEKLPPSSLICNPNFNPASAADDVIPDIDEYDEYVDYDDDEVICWDN